MRLIRYLPLWFFLLLVGCSTSEAPLLPTEVTKAPPPQPLALTLVDGNDFDFAVIGDTLETPEQIFSLSDDAKAHFFSYLNDPANSRYPLHKRVFRYLDKSLSRFNYYADTYTAQQTLDNNSGNCMSLAVLTTAYARLAGLEYKYSRVDSAPVFAKAGKFEVASSHVVTKLFDPTFKPTPGTLFTRKPYLLVDYFPTRNTWVGGAVKNEAFIAMFYRNLAARSMAAEDYKRAASYAFHALEFAPFAPESINVMAVIYRQLGFAAKAEALYRYGLTLNSDSINLLYNYQLLLAKQSRFEQAQALQRRLERLDDPSPFPYLRLADEALANQEPIKALRFYRKSIEKAHYLPHGYLGAAKAYYLMGKTTAARTQLLKALERTHDSAEEQLFKAKLASLGGKRR